LIAGFSRGAEQAAGFARMLHERGIHDPLGMKVTRGNDGLIEQLEFTKPPLVASRQAKRRPIATGSKQLCCAPITRPM